MRLVAFQCTLTAGIGAVEALAREDLDYNLFQPCAGGGLCSCVCLCVCRLWRGEGVSASGTADVPPVGLGGGASWAGSNRTGGCRTGGAGDTDAADALSPAVSECRSVVSSSGGGVSAQCRRSVGAVSAQSAVSGQSGQCRLTPVSECRVVGRWSECRGACRDSGQLLIQLRASLADPTSLALADRPYENEDSRRTSSDSVNISCARRIS